jgi:hypothetical protein
VIPSSGVRTDFIGCHYITYNSDRFPVGSDEIRLSGWWTWVYANLGPRWSHYLVCKFQELLTFLYPRFWPRSYSQVTLVATTRLTLDWFPSVYLPPVLVEFYFKLSSNKHACIIQNYITLLLTIIFVKETDSFNFCRDLLKWMIRNISQSIVGFPAVRHPRLFDFLRRKISV